MEDNVKPRPLTEEELQKVAGGRGITEEECKQLCAKNGLIGFMYCGVCNCRLPDNRKEEPELSPNPGLPFSGKLN